jgi:hypothetical protein
MIIKPIQKGSFLIIPHPSKKQASHITQEINIREKIKNYLPITREKNKRIHTPVFICPGLPVVSVEFR